LHAARTALGFVGSNKTERLALSPALLIPTGSEFTFLKVVREDDRRMGLHFYVSFVLGGESFALWKCTRGRQVWKRLLSRKSATQQQRHGNRGNQWMS
jgi:hypothetical protein